MKPEYDFSEGERLMDIIRRLEQENAELKEEIERLKGIIKHAKHAYNVTNRVGSVMQILNEEPDPNSEHICPPGCYHKTKPEGGEVL
jgi:hypothetical protein